MAFPPGYFDLRYDKNCPQHGEEHDSHWYPLDKLEDDWGIVRGGSRRCNGWHALHRDYTYSPSRFHAPYLRGRKSNLIHRSRYEGVLVWSPPFHEYGHCRVGEWYVGIACNGGVLTNPDLLNAEDVKAAQPYTMPWATKKHKEVTLCAKCFPTGDNEACRILTGQ